MEMDQLKSAWQDMPTDTKKREDLKKMLSENRHPVLKGIRIQLIIEICAWSFFLFFYYDMFDGDKKPLYLNILLVAAVLLLLVHNLTGYFSSRHIIRNGNLQQSLLRYLLALRLYARVSIGSRVLTVICLLVFFTAGIQFNVFKYLALAAIAAVVVLQVFALYRIWHNRIQKIEQVIEGLDGTLDAG